MPELFFEDFRVGTALPAASLTIGHEEAAFFAEAFGAGPNGDAGEPTLSGWHVAALGMRLLFDAFLHRTACLGGPGVESVAWPHPVRVGDRLHFTAEVAAARPSASRPGIGLVTVAIRIHGADGVCVMTQENAVMVARRGAGGAEARS